MCSPRARIVALAVGLGALGSLATAPASFAAAPTAGANCQSQDGKISGRGSTLQLWLQYGLMNAYASDVCGSVPSQGANDITDPGSAIYTLSGGTTYKQNWMTAYNYPSAQQLGSSGANAGTGSGAGQTAIGCRAEAFAGTDIPATASQLSSINGAVPASGGALLGKNCDPTGTSGALVSPFTPQPNFPNPGDQTTHNGVMVMPIGISAVATFANLPTSCLPTSGGVNLTTADMQGIWGGTTTNWNQITDAGLVQPCNLAITRVVRSDNSGTTQSFDNYVADAFGYSTATCQPSSTTAGTFGQMQGNQAANGTDVNWPGGPPNSTPPAGCSPVIAAAGAGGPSQIGLAETTSGAIAYADYSDTLHDTNNFVSQVAGNAIAEFGLQASDGTTNVSPSTTSGGSNCSTTAQLPSGGTPGAVGLGGKWNLTAQTTPNQGVDDIAYSKEGSTYPICSLTWDFVWTGEDGNTPPAPTTTGFAAAATTVPVSSVAGLPSKGTFTVAASDGTDTVSYTGISGTSLTGVTGDTGTVASGAALTFPAGTGGPEANLTADQRRTLYSYFTYLMSPGAQNSETGAGYTALPTSWLSTVRSGFQTNF